jgi:hypothetical protein
MIIKFTWTQEPTSNGAASSTSTKVIYDSSVALDNTLDCEIASISSIGDFSVFKDFDGCFNCINRSATSTKKAHGNHAGTKSC